MFWGVLNPIKGNPTCDLTCVGLGGASSLRREGAWSSGPGSKGDEVGRPGKGCVGHPAEAKRGAGGESGTEWGATGGVPGAQPGGSSCGRCLGCQEGSASHAVRTHSLRQTRASWFCLENEPVALNHGSSVLAALFSHPVCHVTTTSVPTGQALRSAGRAPHASHPSPRAGEETEARPGRGPSHASQLSEAAGPGVGSGAASSSTAPASSHASHVCKNMWHSSHI